MGKGGKLVFLAFSFIIAPGSTVPPPCTVQHLAAPMLGKEEEPWEKNVNMSDMLGAVSHLLWVFKCP